MANPFDVVAKLNEIFEDDDFQFKSEYLGDYFQGESIADYSLEDAVDSVLTQLEDFVCWASYYENGGAYEDLPE
jgi:hypothetical protein